MQKNNGKLVWQPFATSTPRKSLPKQSHHNNLLKNNFIKSSDILKQILINRNESPNQNRKPAQKNRKRNSVFGDGIPSASSSDDEDNEDFHVLLSKKKKLVINISSTSCKEAREQEKTQLSESDILASNKGIEETSKSGASKTIKKSAKKSIGNISNKKNLSSHSKNTFDITLQKSKNEVKKGLKKNSDNSFMLEKLGNNTAGVGQENKKPCEKAEINGKQETLDIYFKQIKNKSASKPKGKTKNETGKTVSKPECSEKIKPKKINKKKASNDNLEANKNQNSVLTNKTKPEVQEGVKNDVNYDSEIFSSPYNSEKASSKPIKKAGKIRSKTLDNEIIPLKKRRMRSKAESDINNSKILDTSDKNSSHQLFSNSKEQELLNSLDLTKEDTNDSKSQEGIQKANTPVNSNQVVKTLQKSPEQLKTQMNVDSSNAVGFNESINFQPAECNKEKQKQLKKDVRRKEPMSLNSDQNVNPNDNLVNSEKNKDHVLPGNNIVNNTAKEKLTKIPVYSKKSILKNAGVPVKSILKNNVEVKERKENDNECVVESSEGAVKRDKSATRDDTNKVTSCKTVGDNEVVSSTGPGMSDVFKKLNSESDFNEFKPGCLNAEVWAVKTYKCGMLKMKPESKHSSKTTSENSYFGGVVVNGSFKMTINHNETVLKVGDMAFVPPLTEWSLHNCGDMDADMYYWCGKFRA